MNKIFQEGESIEYSGKIIVQMAQDSKIIKQTARVVIGAEYGQSHGIRDIDNRVIYSHRQVKALLSMFVLPDNLKFITNFIPSFVKIPQFVIDIATSKF
jgi:hypothetical protein